MHLPARFVPTTRLDAQPASEPRALAPLAFASVVLHAAVAVAQYLMAWGPDVVLATVLYYAATIALLGVYIGVIQQVGASPSRRTKQLVVLVPLAIQIGWLLFLPVLAVDAYSYLVDAAHAHAGLNPYQHAVREAGGTAFGLELATYRWRPVHGISPYGPAWMNIVRAIGPLTTNIALAIFVVKLIALIAIALSAWLLYRTVAPASRVRALTVFWWNPAVIIEAAGEGHNDAVMVAAVILSLWCLRKQAPVAAAGALTIAVLTKWVPVLFGPAYLLYVWRTGMLTRRAIAAGGALVIAIAAAAYWPFWVGMATFDGMRKVGGIRFVASTTGALIRLFPDRGIYAYALRGCAALVTAATTAWGAWTSRTLEDLIRACAIVALVYVLIGSPLYWAWYVLLPIALLAMAGDVATVCVLTVASRLVAPLDLLRLAGLFPWSAEVWLTTIVGLWLPLAFVTRHAVRTGAPRHRNVMAGLANNTPASR